MRYRPLGSTGVNVSEISFGAGPVSGLMTNGSYQDRQAVLARAFEMGINWFDTAAGYGAGRSETHLGEALSHCSPTQPFHVATKVRLMLSHETDLRPLVVTSFRESLQRLKLPRVTLLQLHNSITPNRGDEPTSITPDDVLGPNGILPAFEDLRAEGLVDHFGLTGIGHSDSIKLVLRSQRFATIQAPFHLLNPTTLVDARYCFREPEYGGFLIDAKQFGMGLFAIRCYAAGALLCAPPSAHTLTTPFFPLSLYERDLARARRLVRALGSETAVRELALRYVLSHEDFSSAILGFGSPEHIDEALRISALGPLSHVESGHLESLMQELVTSNQGPANE